MTDTTQCDYCERDDSPAYVADADNNWFACALCEANLQVGADRIVQFWTRLSKKPKHFKTVNALAPELLVELMHFAAGEDVLVEDLIATGIPLKVLHKLAS